ncbi:MAG: HAD family phosphatase [Proteobacteria bacterium]|nr:MAG: HAD family phosphatase [Pseudomonadota bacterium]
MCLLRRRYGVSKIAFFDIDGTLTRADGSISDVVIQAVQSALARGHKIVLASGRPTFGMLDLIDVFGLTNGDGYLISYNGCAIYHIPSSSYMALHALKHDTLQLLDIELQKYPAISPIFYANEQILTTKRNKFVDFEGELNKSQVFEVESYPLTGSPKLIWAGEPSQLDLIEQDIVAKFGYLCTIARSLPCFLEFTPLGVDKGAAVNEVCTLLEHSLVETVAFGDGNNDRAMLQAAGIGVAMENGRDELKAIADFIAPSNELDGVVVAIEKFLP